MTAALTASGLAKSGLAAEYRLAQLERDIRALELAMGFRKWDYRDRLEAFQRMQAQVRYCTAETIAAFTEHERQRLTRLPK